jgi:hypothetical protein
LKEKSNIFKNKIYIFFYITTYASGAGGILSSRRYAHVFYCRPSPKLNQMAEAVREAIPKKVSLNEHFIKLNVYCFSFVLAWADLGKNTER